MTKIKFTKTGNLYRIEAKDHATDSNIVCGAISTMLYAAAGYLANHDEIVIYEQILEPANASLEFRGGAEAQAIYEMAMIGLLQLEELEPKNLKVFLL